MCCHVRSASLSHRRRQQHRHSLPQTPLATLDLGQATERAAHDFLLRATSKRDAMWQLLDLRRQGATLLCVVRWVYPANAAKPFSLADVSLTETAVYWCDYATVDAARAEMKRRCDTTVQHNGTA